MLIYKDILTFHVFILSSSGLLLMCWFINIYSPIRLCLVLLKCWFINIYILTYTLNLPHSSLSSSCYLHWIIQPYLPIPSRRLPFRWAHQIRSAYVFGFREGYRSAYRRRVGDQKDVFIAYLRRICPVLQTYEIGPTGATMLEVTQRLQNDQHRSKELTESRDNT